jgi:hypothetical protein
MMDARDASQSILFMSGLVVVVSLIISVLLVTQA